MQLLYLQLLYLFHVSSCSMPDMLKLEYVHKHDICFKLLKTSAPVQGEFIFTYYIP